MAGATRTVTDAERRARLGSRHGFLEPVADPLAAAAAVVCLHATEPASVHLSSWARSGASRDAVGQALYADRTLVKQLAMRRTVFAFPVDLLPAVRGSAAARVAQQQASLLARSVVAGGLAGDGPAWVEEACAETYAKLTEGPATTAQLRAQLPCLQERLPPPSLPKSAAPGPVASQVLTVLAASGRIVRGDNDVGWTVSRHRWTTTASWLGSDGDGQLTEAEGYAELVRRWLWAFGPGTEADVVWWLGATKTAVRLALDAVGATPVRFEDGTAAWLHPDDTAPVREAASWSALLPTLDPTTMGWHGRSFYVDPAHASAVYDRAGNARPTAWWNGRVVGTWAQRGDGTVVVLPLGELPRDAALQLRRRAAQLSDWLDGHVLRSSLQRPLE